ncbi:MAG: glycoside hydrolase family 3 protein [Candidatus Izemoplasmataceae bacterium]
MKVDLTVKPYNLSQEKIKWVEDTIQSMTLDEKLGQLFVHMTQAGSSEEDVISDIEQTNLGGIRFLPLEKNAMWEMNRLFQKHSKIPVLSAVNVEAGGNGATKDGTVVGQEIKVAATNNPQLAYEFGKICGIEATATGANWAFTPIVDITYNWHNPVISTRAWGNNPDLVLELSKQYFRGISESNMICAMKHFPGDGRDERDQHIATSVNDFSCEEWDQTYGKVFKGLIEEGVQAVMTGHIMLPSYQKYFSPNTKNEDVLPATVCKEVITDLLKDKLGFNGLVVTDASHMVGVSSRTKRSEMVPAAIMAGNDMFLFFNDIEEDYKYMKDAYLDGRLTEERVLDALRRILGTKAALGLDTFTLADFPKKEALDVIGCEEHKEVAKQVADQAITLAKQVGPNIFPLTPEKYKRVLLVPVGPEGNPILALAGMGADGSKVKKQLKEALEDNGFDVELYVDPLQSHIEQMAKLPPDQIMELQRNNSKKSNKNAYNNKQKVSSLTDNYDIVIAFANVSATMRTTQRLEWALSKGGWDNPWYVNEIPTIFVSFQCPFHLADVPQIKNYINAYDADPITVSTLVDKLVGKSEFKGVSTVDVFCDLFDTRF